LPIIYFDNAATSWPKPDCVIEEMRRFLKESGANPGRSGHRLSVQAGRKLYETRLFGFADPLRLVFAHNATMALNLALSGLLRAGDHVITSSMEHNSVMRPLRHLERRGVALTVVTCAADGTLDPERLEGEIRPQSRMIVLNHASNVTGTLLPVREAGRLARRHGLLLLVDAAQTAGAVPIGMSSNSIDLLAFSGHKSLYGPTGTGGLIVGERVDHRLIEPLMHGGTGSRSEHEKQPDFLPDRLESGTPNTIGLAGLAASARWLLDRGIDSCREQEIDLTRRLIDGLKSIPGVVLYGPGDPARQTATVSFGIEGLSPSDAGLRLDEEFDIQCRVGLHCAPAAHRTLGTFPHGTVRFGLGLFNSGAEVDHALSAIETLRPGSRH